MAESFFGEKAVVPDSAALAAALKEAGPLWQQVAGLGGGTGEWKFYTKAAGWIFPVKLGKRTLFYMMPKDGWFRMTFVFGERATEAAKTAGLPEAVLADLLQSRAYAEGRSVGLDVRAAADVATVQKLLELKLAY